MERLQTMGGDEWQTIGSKMRQCPWKIELRLSLLRDEESTSAVIEAIGFFILVSNGRIKIHDKQKTQSLRYSIPRSSWFHIESAITKEKLDLFLLNTMNRKASCMLVICRHFERLRQR